MPDWRTAGGHGLVGLGAAGLGSTGLGLAGLGAAAGDAAAAAVAVAVAVADQAYRRAARSAVAVPPPGRGVIVVLGVPGTNAATRAVQRWRVELAVQTWRWLACNRVIFTGGAVRSEEAEAAQMAAVARRLGLDPAVIVVEDSSTSTWENVTKASQLAGDVDYVVLVSDALHAARARNYWRDQHPGPVPALFLADRYRPLDHFWWRTPATMVELLHRARARLRSAPASGSRPAAASEPGPEAQPGPVTLPATGPAQGDRRRSGQR